MTVVLFSWGDAIEGGTAEALALADALAQAGGADLHWVVTADLEAAAAQIAGRYGVRRLDVLDAGLTGHDERVASFAAYCAEHRPQTMLFNQTVEGRVVAARLAGRLGVPVVANVVAIEREGAGLRVEATAYGGDTRAEYRLKAPVNVVAVMTTGLAAQPRAEALAFDIRRVPAAGGAAAGFAVVSAPQIQEQRLEDADIIVSGGRGLGRKENFELVKQMAEALGGMWGGSRAIVDDGWIDSSRQVGLTGKITRPGLYIALGISGASQHMAGCSAAKTIVAINKDPDASIFRYARYGVVGDCVELLPELIRAARG